jgi:hypothetical protein
MSERTCQLCGKTLSRIRVGGGEEFCSREHRTQYRLRRGMDRLQEANKVASLMRRRENPKPIAVSPVAETVWRGYFNTMVNANRPIQFPRRAGLGKQFPGLPAAGYATLRPAGNPRRAGRRLLDAGFQSGTPQNLALPRSGVPAGGSLPQAPAVIRPAALPAGARRQQELTRNAGRFAIVPPRAGTIRARAGGAAAAAYRAVPMEATAGAILRVSRAVGFRLAAPQMFQLGRGGPTPAALAWPEWIGQQTRPCAVRERQAEVMQVPFPKPWAEAECHWKSKPDLGPGLPGPKILRLSGSLQNDAAAERVPGPMWSRDGDIVHLPRRTRAIEEAGLSTTIRLLPLVGVPFAHIPAQRISVVPIGSGDMTLGYSEEEHSI